MRTDWILGLGAVSTLAVLVGLDLLLGLAEDRGREASHALLRLTVRSASDPRRRR
jgi:hypothetical protein